MKQETGLKHAPSAFHVCSFNYADALELFPKSTLISYVYTGMDSFQDKEGNNGTRPISVAAVFKI
jgi:hypothetical protein